MKKTVLTIAGALMLCLSTTSCGGDKSALDINISELESACDFVDALNDVADELVGLTDDGELGDDEKEQFDKLMEKGEEIGDTAQESFPREDGEACVGWDAMQEKMDKVDQFR